MARKKKLKIETIEKLKQSYNQVATDYEKALCILWEISDGYWVGDEKGGLYCFRDTECISYNDMVFSVNNLVSFNDYLEWTDYCLDASEFGFNKINLKSWVSGCPRVPKDTFDKLKKMKLDLETEIERERKDHDY